MTYGDQISFSGHNSEEFLDAVFTKGGAPEFFWTADTITMFASALDLDTNDQLFSDPRTLFIVN